jgi:HK97 family phage portal protein
LSATPTGVTVTHENATDVTAVFQAIRFLSFMIASLPRKTYQRKQNGDRVTARWHPLYGILHDIPNEEMTSFDLWALLGSHVFGRGNAFAEIVFDATGRVQSLYPLNPARMELKRNENDELRYIYTLPKVYDHEKRALRPEQVLHLRGLTREGLWGLSVVSAHRNAVGLAKATEEFASSYFGNGAEPGVVLRHPKRLDTDVHERIKTSWEQAHMGLEKAHRVAILEEDMSIEKVGFNPQDSQFLETRQFQTLEIARMFGIPPHLLFELTHATFTNIEHQSLEFVIYHLRPWLINFEQQIFKSLFLPREREAGYYTEFLVDGITRGDIATRYNAYSVGLTNGIYSINEVRRLENMNKIPGGDTHYIPLNMSALGADGKPAASDAAKNPNTPTREQSYVVYTHPLLLDAADRILRRENNDHKNAQARRPEKFVEWIHGFYGRDYPEYIGTVLEPLIQSRVLSETEAKRFIAEYPRLRRAAIADGFIAPDPEWIVEMMTGGEYHGR